MINQTIKIKNFSSSKTPSTVKKEKRKNKQKKSAEQQERLVTVTGFKKKGFRDQKVTK